MTSYTIANAAAAYEIETLTHDLRWNGDVLEQAWLVKEYPSGRARHEWRPVPRVETK